MIKLVREDEHITKTFLVLLLVKASEVAILELIVLSLSFL